MPVKKYEIYICDDCYNLIGKMCNDPKCIFCRRTMDEIIRILDDILIRPILYKQIERKDNYEYRCKYCKSEKSS